MVLILRVAQISVKFHLRRDFEFLKPAERFSLSLEFLNFSETFETALEFLNFSETFCTVLDKGNFVPEILGVLSFI